MKKLLVILFYLLLSSLITFPLIFNLDKIFIGWPLDAYNYLWNIDTFWKQIVNFQNPFSTDRIFYPLGTNLIFHTYAPLISIFAGLFLKHQVIYLNLLVLISPALSAYFAYLLVKHITKNNAASFLSGIIYGFSPVIVSFLISQHYYFAFAAPILPLGLLFLIKFLETGENKNLIALILLFWSCVGIDYYTTIMFIIINFTFFALYSFLHFKGVKENLRANIKNVVVTTSLLLIVPAAIIYSQLGNSAEGSNYLTAKSHYPSLCSATIQRLFTPSQYNPFLKDLGSIPINHDTPSVFLGFLIPIIAAISLFLIPIRKTLPFFGIFVVIFYFSLGPTTKFFDLITRIPFLGLIDCPQRFVIGIELPLSILVGLLLAKIKQGKLSTLLFIFITLVIFVEYSSWNIPYSKMEVPNVYKEISSMESGKTVLELPSGIADSKGAFGYDWSIEGLLLKQMYWQTIHDKPRVGGYTSRLNSTYYEFFENEPVISSLFRMSSVNGKWDEHVFTQDEVSTFIDKFNVGFIILSPNSRQPDFAKVVENLFEKQITKKVNSEGYILYLVNN